MKRWLILAIAVVLVAVLGLVGYSTWQGISARRAALESPAEETAVARRGTLLVTVSGTGSLAPVSEVSLAFTTGGRVAEVLVGEGQQVEAGQVLVRLESDDLALQVAQAEATLSSAQAQLAQVLDLPDPEAVVVSEANLRKAEVSLERAQGAYDRVAWRPEIAMLPQSLNLEEATLDYEYALADYNLASQGASSQDIAIAESSVAEAEIGLEQAQLRLEEATLTAPMAGTVSALNVQLGEIAGAGQAAVVLSDLAVLEVDVNLDETDVTRVAVGQEALVSLDAFPDAELAGEVTYIAPIATIQSGVVLYPVTVRMGPTDVAMRAGMTADVEIVTASREDALIVPLRAVHTEGEGAYVYRLAGGQTERVQVELGLMTDTEVEITSGLEQGDVVSVVAVPIQGATGQGFGPGGMFGGGD